MSTAIKPGKVYLVGGGPGDPGLLTLRARSLMEQVDVVAYDALISPALLALIPEHVEIVAIGYRGYRCKVSYGMHPEVIELALQGKDVLRLKAGDPFIFGRGTQECTDLLSHNIPFEVVPGISSALGAAAYSGFPLTSIGDASDVTLASGHTCSPEKPAWQAMGQGTGTLAIYMGAKRIRRNCQVLMDLGRNPDTPAIYISAATTSEHFDLEATLSTLADKVEALDITAPALIIIGEVVTLRSRFNWRALMPLTGKRALVMREGEEGDIIQQSLENMGAIVFRLPEPQVQSRLSEDDFETAMTAQRLVFTCAGAVSAWLEAMVKGQFDRRNITCCLNALSEEAVEALNQAGLFEVQRVNESDLAGFGESTCVLAGFTELSALLAGSVTTISCFTRRSNPIRFELPGFDLAVLHNELCYHALDQQPDCLKNSSIYSPDKALTARLQQQLMAKQVALSEVVDEIGQDFQKADWLQLAS